MRKAAPPPKLTSIGNDRLEAWALDYLGRFASSADNLQRVLRRRVRRRLEDAEAVPEVDARIDALVARYLASGLLDDAAYAEAKARLLHRRGSSAAAIRAQLRGMGVDGERIGTAIASLGGDRAEIDLAAACAFARRRRLGPFRLDTAGAKSVPDRALGAFARAGFSRAVAERVLGCHDPAAVEALLQEAAAE